MTINNNSVEQINVALLDMDKKIKRANSANNANDLKNLEASVDSIKRTLNETAAGLESGKTYNINISGNAATATRANNAGTAETATNAETAINANHADTATTADTATNANIAEKATKDGGGNVISSTYVKVSDLVNAVYPVNTVYESIVDTDPSTYFTGTTWVQIQTTPTFKWKRTA